MKKIIQKNSRKLLPLFLGVFALIVFITASVAIYTNQGYKKGVAITADSVAMFSSNRLDQISKDDTDAGFSKKDVAVQDSGNETVNFSFTIYNYAPNAPTRINPNDITYDLTATWSGNTGSESLSGFQMQQGSAVQEFVDKSCTISNLTLAHGVSASHTFTVTMPKAALNAGVKLTIKAMPQAGSYSAVNNKALAVILTPYQSSEVTPVTNNWTGHWVEKTYAATQPALKPSDCAAFNYEISGSGKGTITLTCPTGMEIDAEFLKKHTELTPVISVSGDTVTLSVDSNTKESLYTIRFYRTGTELAYPEGSFDNWTGIDTYISE